MTAHNSTSDDEHHIENNSKTPRNIANWIATKALFSSNIQFSANIKPGMVSRSYGSNLDKYLTSSVLIHHPVFEIASRGVMVERGLIDFDEVDMGWLISEAIAQENQWHQGTILNLGKLFLMAPIAAGVGYIISEMESNNDFFDINDIQEYTILFLENSTPEDTVNLYKTLSKVKPLIDFNLFTDGGSIHEEIENILASEMNLLDFYNKLSDNYLIYKELASNYEISTKVGFSSFYEALNEDYEFKDAITHTYVSIMSQYPDSTVFHTAGRVKALKISQMAKEVVELGSIFNPDGIKKMEDLQEYYSKNIGNVVPTCIDDLTTNITFLAALSGLKP